MSIFCPRIGLRFVQPPQKFEHYPRPPDFVFSKMNLTPSLVPDNKTATLKQTEKTVNAGARTNNFVIPITLLIPPRYREVSLGRFLRNTSSLQINVSH